MHTERWITNLLIFNFSHFSPSLRINPLNAELNPICHLLALLRAHHILHVSRLRVNILKYCDCNVKYAINALLSEHISTSLIRNNFILRDFCLCTPSGRVKIRFYPRTCLRVLGKLWKSFASITDIHAKIRNRHLTNTSVKCHRFTRSPVKRRMMNWLVKNYA